jgi:hypothetical protein
MPGIAIDDKPSRSQEGSRQDPAGIADRLKTAIMTDFAVGIIW